MTRYLEKGEELDRWIFRALHGRQPADDDVVQAYSADEEVILAALHARFGPLEVAWQQGEEWPSRDIELVVSRAGRQFFVSQTKGDHTLILCAAVLHMATTLADERVLPVFRTGFYWLRPEPGFPFFPWASVSVEGDHVYGFHSVFQKSGPVPVFVDASHGRAEATGIGCPLDWPEYPVDGGAMTVPVSVLPGEWGPRIEPPPDWHRDFRPEELNLFPGIQSAMYEDEEHK